MTLKVLVPNVLAALRRWISGKPAATVKPREKGRPLDQNSELVPPFPPF